VEAEPGSCNGNYQICAVHREIDIKINVVLGTDSWSCSRPTDDTSRPTLGEPVLEGETAGIRILDDKDNIKFTNNPAAVFELVIELIRAKDEVRAECKRREDVSLKSEVKTFLGFSFVRLCIHR
jgi:hypothetical protein